MLKLPSWFEDAGWERSCGVNTNVDMLSESEHACCIIAF